MQPLQVPQAAVQELRRTRGRPGAEVVLLDERDAKSARGRVEGGPGPRDAPAHDQEVEPFSAKACEMVVPSHRGRA
jgi:hypothetical protein